MNEYCWNPVELSFHNHKTIDPFSHFLWPVLDFLIVPNSKFLWGKLPVSALEPYEVHASWALHLVWAGTCKVHWKTSQFQWKHQSRHQGLTGLSMELPVFHPIWCWFFGISPLNHLSSFIFTMNRWTNMQYCFLQGSCRLCGCHFWISLELAGISCQFRRVTSLYYTEGVTTIPESKLGECSHWSHRTTVCKPFLSTWGHGTFLILPLLYYFHMLPSEGKLGCNTVPSLKRVSNVFAFIRFTSALVSAFSRTVGHLEKFSTQFLTFL